MVFNFKLNLKHFFGIFLLLFLVVTKTDNKDLKTNSNSAEELYRRLYKLERTEQAAAIKALMKLGNEFKKSKMVEAIAQKVFNVIKKSKFILEKAEYSPGVSSFPTEEATRDALSNILENTAFLGDVVLRLPDLTQRIISNNTEWNELFKWSLTFANSSLLIDNKTNDLLNLVSQEMNYTQRLPNYVNPHKNVKVLPDEDQEKVKNVRKKKSLPKGPRLSSRQFGDL